MVLILSLKSTSPPVAKSLSLSPKLLAFGGLIPLLTVNPKILISLKLSKLSSKPSSSVSVPLVTLLLLPFSAISKIPSLSVSEST